MLLPNLLITIVAFAALSTMYKVSQVRKCESWVFLAGLYAVACASSVVSLATRNAELSVPGKFLAMGIATGFAGVLCLLCVLGALKHGGKLSLVSVIGKLSLTVPILFAMVFLGEKLSLLRIIGLALFVVFVVLLQEPARAGKKEGPS